MKSDDRFSVSRKSHSATRVGEVDKVLSSCDYKSNIRIACASASCTSSREKVRNSKISWSDHESSEYFKKDYKNKLFLYASQILGKLKKVNRKHEDSLFTTDVAVDQGNINTKKFKLSFRKVNFYYDLLKRLLEERCILLLKEESRSCVMHTQKLVSDLKLLYSNELIKLTTMPVKSYNRFIDSSGINISVVEQLFKKVNYICDLHSSLKNSYQNIINLFQVGFDIELNQMLIKINRFQNKLYSEMVFWTHRILEVFILKLCLADADSVSPEFLHRVVGTCESFNLLFFDKRQINYAYLTNTYNILFNSFIESDYEAVLLDFILQYLSHFEAKVAAEKVIQYLIYECKNNSLIVLKQNGTERDTKDISNSNTSDYYSASPTVVEENFHRVYNNTTFCLEGVFSSFIQRNQSLVLKYLYSIICLDSSVPYKSRNYSLENSLDSPTGILINDIKVYKDL